jgi:hypothetical protein
MSMPPPASGGRPDQSVNPDASFQMAESFGILTGQMSALQRAISTQTQMMERQLQAQNRFSMSGGLVNPQGAQAPFSQTALNQVIGAGGAPSSPYGLQQVTSTGALSSLEQGRAWMAQRAGEWLAGGSLYSPAASGIGTGGAGTAPNAGGAPQGGGGGGGGSGGAPPPAQRLTGLPAQLYGGINPPSPNGPQAPGMRALQQAGARVALSGGSFGGVMNAARSLPVVGLGIDAVQGATNFYLDQREAGRQYQNIEGGSNLAAQAERWHSFAYGASMFGRMPEGAAAQAFGQVTALGYNQAAVGQQNDPQNRNSALGFIYQNYTNNGMSVDQSTQVLQSASQNATINLQKVTSALTELSTVAGQAGDNANSARQSFIGNMTTAISSGGASGSPAAAGGLAAMQASYGKSFAGVNMSGELGTTQQTFLAGRYGMSPAQVQSLMRNNPGQYARMLSGNNMAAIGSMLTPQMQSSLQQMISQAGGAGALKDPATAAQISNQFLNKWQALDPSLTVQNLSSVLNQQSGADIPSGQIMSWIVNQVAGNNEAAYTHSGASAGWGGTQTGQYGLANPVHGSLGPGKDQNNMSQTWQDVLKGASGGTQAANAYLKQVSAQGGKRNPVLEALLQNAQSGDHVSVQTKNGTRVMSMSQAMKFYPNELAKGDVDFYNSSGKLLGNTASLTNGLVASGADVAGEESQRAGSKQGLSMSKWQQAHPNSTQLNGGNHAVTITLSQEAAQLLKLVNAQEQAAAAGTVPSVPWNTSASR